MAVKTYIALARERCSGAKPTYGLIDWSPAFYRENMTPPTRLTF